MSSACQDNSFTLSASSSVVMAVKTQLSDGTKIVYGPSSTTPNPTNNQIWVYFPKWSYNNCAANQTTDVWVGFNKSAFYKLGFAQLPDTSFGATANTCNTSTSCNTNFSSSSSSNSCQGFVRTIPSPPASSTTAPGTIANFVFNSCIADTVNQTDSPATGVIYLNLYNGYCYHAGNNTVAGVDNQKGVNFVFPEATCGYTNIILSTTDRTVVDAYRKSGFSHPSSSEVTTPVAHINHLFTQMNKYMTQNKASVASQATSCSNTFSASVYDSCPSVSSCASSCTTKRNCKCASCSPF